MEWIVYGTLLVLLGGGFLAVAWYSRPSELRTTFPELARQLGSKGRFGRGWSGVHEGIPYRYKFDSEGRDADYWSLRVRITGAPTRTFQVTPRTGLDQFWKQVGIDSPLHTGNADFDRKFFVDQCEPGFPAEFFADEGHRDAVAAIMERGFTAVCGDGICLEARRARLSLSNYPDPGLITNPVENLAKLAGAHAGDPVAFSKSAKDWKADPSNNIGSAGMLALVVFLAMYTATSVFPPLDGLLAFLISLRLSVPALALIAWLLVRLARARHRSPRVLTANLVFVAIGIPFVCWSGLIILNGVLDRGAETAHVVKIFDRIESHGLPFATHSHPSYYLLVQSWHAPDAKEEIQVDAHTYRKALYGGDMLQITTGAGRFGIEWKISTALVEKPNATSIRRVSGN